MSPVEEDEQMAGNRIGIKGVADNAEQTLEGLAHIDRRSAKGNTCVGWDRQHVARAFRSSAMYRGEVSVNRMMTP